MKQSSETDDAAVSYALGGTDTRIGARRLSVQWPYLHKMQRRHFLFFSVVPLIGTVFGVFWFSKVSPTLLDACLFFAFWLISGVGISAGYHRLLCHRSFEATSGVRVAMTICGSVAAQGAALSWVAMHRRHHQIPDEVGDVHSPNLHDNSAFGKMRGFVRSHVTWMLRHEYPNVVHYVPDLLRDRPVMWAARYYMLWAALGLLIPAAIGGAIGGSLQAAVSGLLSGGLIRLFVVGQSISALNSVLHTMGKRRFRTRTTNDNSRNSSLLGLLVWGEGWHNNHHAFPYSASFALAWYKIDVSYWVIRLLGILGLARNIKVPDPEALRSRSVCG
jgi:stearoyl-CoA desaturase (Delta-9 desaturase)